jgi:hypothetical protein
MVVTDPADEHHPNEDSGGVDRHVYRRPQAARDEMLVELVGRGVGNPGCDRPAGAARGAKEQEAEHGELEGVRQLPQGEVLLEAGSEIRDRGQDEDQRRPGDDRDPPRRHGPAY